VAGTKRAATPSGSRSPAAAPPVSSLSPKGAKKVGSGDNSPKS
jgi:hypothetical protein